jgi:hypothetical protein
MKLVGFLLLLFPFVGCYSRITPTPQIYEALYEPAINQVAETMLGDVMISRTEGYYVPGFIFTKEYQPPFKRPLVRAFTICQVVGIGTSHGEKFFLCQNKEYEILVSDVVRSWRPYRFCLLIDGNGQLYGESTCDALRPTQWPTKGEKAVLRPVDKIFQKGSFKQELLYNGKSQTTIKLSYREFNDDFARAAFTQELSYDLSEGSTIGFRGMKIDVIEATNSAIKFIIKSTMN